MVFFIPDNTNGYKYGIVMPANFGWLNKMINNIIIVIFYIIYIIFTNRKIHGPTLLPYLTFRLFKRKVETEKTKIIPVDNR